MNVNPKAIALNGVGFGVLAVATLGFRTDDTTSLPLAPMSASSAQSVMQAQAIGAVAGADAQAADVVLTPAYDAPKVDTAAAVAQLLATQREPRLTAAYRTPTVSLKFGQLLKYANRQDAAFASDFAQLAPGKRVTDSAFASDVVIRVVGKGAGDTVGVSFSTRFDASKLLADPAFASDSLSIGSVKVAVDGVLASDNRSIELSKALFENVYVTHDTDGATTVEDDQEFSMFKQINRGVTVGDQMSLVMHFARLPTDGASVGDDGYLFMQSYCDITYFAEDYVGAYRTFT